MVTGAGLNRSCDAEACAAPDGSRIWVGQPTPAISPLRRKEAGCGPSSPRPLRGPGPACTILCIRPMQAGMQRLFRTLGMIADSVAMSSSLSKGQQLSAVDQKRSDDIVSSVISKEKPRAGLKCLLGMQAHLDAEHGEVIAVGQKASRNDVEFAHQEDPVSRLGKLPLGRMNAGRKKGLDDGFMR